MMAAAHGAYAARLADEQRQREEIGRCAEAMRAKCEEIAREYPDAIANAIADRIAALKVQA